MQEAMIMQALREEGLITRPQGQGASGFSFEITAEGAMMKRPPPRLEKLEKRRKKKRALTEDEIREKLERAERRKRVSLYKCWFGSQIFFYQNCSLLNSKLSQEGAQCNLRNCGVKAAFSDFTFLKNVCKFFDMVSVLNSYTG